MSLSTLVFLFACSATSGPAPAGTEHVDPTEPPVDDTDPPDLVEAEIGPRCALDARIGTVDIVLTEAGGQAASLSGYIHDGPDPWIGAPALENEHCTYHAYDPSVCGGPCEVGLPPTRAGL